ncbi:hypothetical protein KY092_17355 [Natronomonas gomsonensis]|nr:hypothetical protein [Natronomonas gomsonensis]MCY4732323.1 hypothetical protein [Natronomonas gomsonensis]
MILITGLLLAVLLVGLALVVNSAIYTENLSTREVEGSSQALADDPPDDRTTHPVDARGELQQRHRKLHRAPVGD